MGDISVPSCFVHEAKYTWCIIILAILQNCGPKQPLTDTCGAAVVPPYHLLSRRRLDEFQASCILKNQDSLPSLIMMDKG